MAKTYPRVLGKPMRPRPDLSGLSPEERAYMRTRWHVDDERRLELLVQHYGITGETEDKM